MKSIFYPENAAPGEETDVVFLHGLFGRGKNFTTIAAGLTPEFRSMLIDLPNHGESEWTQDFDYEEIADTVSDHIVHEYGVGRSIDLVGHSMGGKVAMILALRHPDLVRKMAVIDISPVSTHSSSTEFNHLLDSLSGLNLAEINSRREAHEQLRNQISSDTVRGFLLQNLKRVNGGFEWEPNLQLLQSSLDKIMSFPTINQPAYLGDVLWINGEKSDYVKDEYETEMKKLFPLVKRKTVAGAGHWVHSEKPKEVISILRSFFLN